MTETPEQQDPTQPSPKPGGLHRWYDMDIRLGELVAAMESLSEEAQTLFAFLINTFCDEIVRARGRHFFTELSWDKLIGIYKSKSGRRWYDQQDVLHKAFNKLYSLNGTEQAFIARELNAPCQLVQQYENFCRQENEPLDTDMSIAIIATCFLEGPEAAEERYTGFGII